MIDENLQRRARELYVPGVFGFKRVAQELGISTTTARRYVSEEHRLRDLERSRDYKRSITGTCERCGGVTRYNGKSVNGASRICNSCAHTYTHCAKGHPLTELNRVKNRGRGKRKTGFVCRICPNAYMRAYQERRRRAAGVPKRPKEYKRPVDEMLRAELAISIVEIVDALGLATKSPKLAAVSIVDVVRERGLLKD